MGKLGTYILGALIVLLLKTIFAYHQADSRYKNTNPEIVKYDSLVTAEIDSLITTTYRK